MDFSYARLVLTFALFVVLKGPSQADIPTPVRDYLLGFTTDADGLDLNNDGAVDLADLLAGILGTSTPGDITPLSQIGGSMTQIVLRGDVVYAAEFNRLTTYDISDPLSPKLVATLKLPGAIQDIQTASDSDHLYVSLGVAGIAIVDVSSPLAPILARVAAFPDAKFEQIQVVGSRLYASAGDAAGFMVFDASDVLQPMVLGSVDFPGYPGEFVISGDYAYVSDGTGMRIIDVANPAAPVLANTVSGLLPNDMVARGDRIYGSFNLHGYAVIDIHDPVQPVIINTFFPFTNSAMAISETTLFGGYSGWIMAISLADENSEVTLSQIDGENLSAAEMAAEGSRLVVARYGGGLRVYDYSQPASPVVQGQAPVFGAVVDVEVSNGVALAVNERVGLEILDVSDPASPVRLASYPFTGAADVEVSGDRAYLAGSSHAGVDILDITSPSAPTRIARINSRFAPLAIGGTNLYASSPFTILDVSDPAAPVALGSINHGGKYLEITGTRAVYLSLSGTGTLSLLDISNPASPTSLGTYTGTGLGSFALTLDRAYVATGYRGFLVLDLTAPTAPTLITAFEPSNFYASGVAAKDNLVFMTGERQLRAFDMTNPAAPQLLGSGPTQTRGPLEFSGSEVYICGGNGGLEILRYTGPMP